MAKNTIRDYDPVAPNNTDIGGVGATGGTNGSKMDDLIREMASHLADVNKGNEPLEDTFTVADPADTTKRVRIDAGAVGAGQTRVINMPDEDITLGSVADNAVTEAKIATNAVTEPKIAANAVTEAKINNSAVTTDKLGANAVTAAKASVATQAEAEAGNISTKLMTPQRVSQAIAALSAGGGGLQSMQVFTTSGTWNRPSDVTKVLMFVTGGGGGGSNLPRGGGAGGTAIKFLDVSSISSATITVGSGGGQGSNGGNSSWADATNTITANGGTGGASPPNAGGTASGGDLNLTGGDGHTPQGTSDHENAHGGAPFWGGATSPPLTSSSNGRTGSTFGGGGSGAGSSSRTGGSGAPGVVWILEFL